MKREINNNKRTRRRKWWRIFNHFDPGRRR
jgi:hypothetical protein